MCDNLGGRIGPEENEQEKEDREKGDDLSKEIEKIHLLGKQEQFIDQIKSYGKSKLPFYGYTHFTDPDPSVDLEEQKELQYLRHDGELHSFRLEVAEKLFSLIDKWLGWVIVLLWVIAIIPWVNLSDSVLIALLTTSTANVIGMHIIVSKWLFPKKGFRNRDEQKEAKIEKEKPDSPQ